MSVNLYRIFTFRFWQKLEFQKATHACAFCFWLSVSRLFASDTSPKWIDREGLGKRRPRTRLACVASFSVWFRSKNRPWKGIFGFDSARNETRTNPSPLFYLRHFSRGLWLDLVPHSLLLNRTETQESYEPFYYSPGWTVCRKRETGC